METDRSGVSKIEARLVFVDDRALMYLAEVLKVEVQELFPKHDCYSRLHDFLSKLETPQF